MCAGHKHLPHTSVPSICPAWPEPHACLVTAEVRDVSSIRFFREVCVGSGDLRQMSKYPIPHGEHCVPAS
jgi:hypothetical protein